MNANRKNRKQIWLLRRVLESKHRRNEEKDKIEVICNHINIKKTISRPQLRK